MGYLGEEKKIPEKKSFRVRRLEDGRPGEVKGPGGEGIIIHLWKYGGREPILKRQESLRGSWNALGRKFPSEEGVSRAVKSSNQR